MTATFTVMSMDELDKKVEDDRRALAKRMRAGTAHWGHWWYVLDQDTGVLRYRDSEGHELCEIDLARCDTATEILDWVLQTEGKAWATDEDLGSLVRALTDLLPIRNWTQDPMARHDVAASIRETLTLAD